MDIDNLKDQWAAFNENLEQNIKFNATLLRQSAMNHSGAALHRLSRWLFVELLINFVVVIFLGSFIADHIHMLKFCAPAITLDLVAIALVGFTIHQLIALRAIDYGAPILAIQKRLESLRSKRIRATQWTLLISPLLWTPLLIVALKGFWGIDAYTILDRYWLASNLLVGLALIPLIVWISKRFGDRWQRSPFIQQLMNDIAGRNLISALAFIETIGRYEQDGE